MGRGMAGKIFINYRRDDTRDSAARLRDRLAGVLGENEVFMDVDNLLPGERFDLKLREALASTDIFLAVIGARWMDLLRARLESGERDFVCEEIAAALAAQIAIIPVVMDRAPLPKSRELPEHIRDLVLYHKHDVAYESFGRDAQALIGAIEAQRRRLAQRKADLYAKQGQQTHVGRIDADSQNAADPGFVTQTERRSVRPVGPEVPYDGGGVTELEKTFFRFWKQLQEHAQKRNANISFHSAQPHYWLNAKIGVRGAIISFNIRRTEGAFSVELYIPDNKKLYAHFFNQKDAIERDLAEKPEWMELRGKKASRIRVSIPGDLGDETNWESYFDELLKLGEKIRTVLPKYSPAASG